MDKNDLEKERGITILAKCTSIIYDNVRINIVDTPGHADFGGEVERILSMVDGVVVLVDAVEGVMPQTKFVVSKALQLNLHPIVLINKIDKQESRPDEIHFEILHLFELLGATDSQQNFPLLYASGRSGWAITNLDDERKDLQPLFQTIIKCIPEAKHDTAAPFKMLVSLLEYDPFLGRLLIGKVESGVLKPGSTLHALSLEGEKVEQARITKVFGFSGIERIPLEEAAAGNIIALAGFTNATVTNTIAETTVSAPLQALPIDPPTLSIVISVNDSPFAGKEGSLLTSREIRNRLLREAESNVAIKVQETAEKDAFEVFGRGELQLGVLIETMRREGFEMTISRPRVLLQTIDDVKHEPLEELQIDVDEEYVGVVVEKLGIKRGEMIDMRPSGFGKTRVTFIVPSRGLIGYHGEFLTDTRGTGVMSRIFHGYGAYRGEMEERRNGVLISTETGVASSYALFNLEKRGQLFIDGGVNVYTGMIIGEHSRENDLEVNPLKAKQLTNVRAAGKDEAIRITPPRIMSLESAMTYIQDDEVVEITPKCIRLRKRFLDSNERKRMSR